MVEDQTPQAAVPADVDTPLTLRGLDLRHGGELTAQVAGHYYAGRPACAGMPWRSE